MASTEFDRRLAAVLAADVVGYSRLMHEDETYTQTAYNKLMDEVISPLIAKHGGRIVKSTGDGFLAEFSTATGSVECAYAAQNELAQRNADLPSDRRIDFRLGVNLGDIIIDRDDIFGDGVNIASRLEGVSRPGGICVSGSIYENVRHKLPFSFHALGPHKVKNIAEPVRVYRVDLTEAEKHPLIPPRITHSLKAKNKLLLITPAFLVGVTAVAFWAGLFDPPLPPRIAILPFANMSGDPSQAYFSDGLSENIITDLSKAKGIFVIARNSSFFFRGKKATARTIGETLHVNYLLEGSVQRQDNRFRIHAQLIDAKTGGHLWAAKFESDYKKIFSIQDQITEKIVGALAIQLSARETTRIQARETSSTAAFDEFLRGWSHYRMRTPEDFATAATHFNQALQFDPGYARAYAALAATYLDSRTDKFRALRLTSRFEAVTLARENLSKAQNLAREKNIEEPLIERVAAQISYIDRRFDDAMNHVRRAIEIDPNDAESIAQLGRILTWTGRARDAKPLLRKALLLEPVENAAYLSRMGITKFALDDFTGAARDLERSFEKNPRSYFPLVHLLAAYGHLGRQTQAAETYGLLNEKRRAVGRGPYTLNRARLFTPYKEVRDLMRLLDGLEKAGVPAGDQLRGGRRRR